VQLLFEQWQWYTYSTGCADKGTLVASHPVSSTVLETVQRQEMPGFVCYAGVWPVSTISKIADLCVAFVV
jgi:hypothetical protein